MSATEISKRHAVVLGGSIAGLLAARALCDHFDRVTIVEKDHLANDGDVRASVPQGAHVHGMLARGLEIIEGLLPGVTKEMVDGGASLMGGGDARIYIAGWRKAHDNPLKILSATRPFIEWALARRVRALPKPALLEETEAVGVIGDASRVVGVKLRAGETVRELAADLVIDARGRRSNLADWMRAVGAECPAHETSPLASAYCSYLLEPAPGAARPPALQVVTMEEKIGVLVFPVERGRVLLSVGANAQTRMPQSHDEMLAFTERLPVPDAHLAIKALRPITPPKFSRFTASVRRNFDSLSRPPEGIVAIGDAIASFNPIFGQGMTVAALEADWLGKCLAANDPRMEGFAKAYYAGVKPIVDVAWGAPDLEAKRNNPAAQPWSTRFVLWYTARMQETASRDAFVSRTIAEVQNMLSPPIALFSPSMFLRVLFA